MKEKEMKNKGLITKFAKKYATPTALVLVSYAVGVHLGNKVYKNGCTDAFDAVCTAIVNASYDGGGLRLNNVKNDTYLFKATKVLKD